MSRSLPSIYLLSLLAACGSSGGHAQPDASSDAAAHDGPPSVDAEIAPPTTGTPLSAVAVHGAALQGVEGVAADNDGSYVVVGAFNASATIGTETTRAPNDVWGGFVARFSSDGQLTWLHDVPDCDATFSSVAIAPDHTIVVTGQASASSGGCQLNFAGQMHPIDEGFHGVIARYAADGSELAAASFGGTSFASYASADDVAIDADGGITTIGYFDGTIAFAGGDTLTDTSSTDMQVAIAAFDGGTLATRWVRALRADMTMTTAPSVHFGGVAALPNGDVVAGGLFGGSLDLGGAAIVDAGLWVAQYAKSDGSLVEQASYGGAFDAAWALAALPNGDVALAGLFAPSINFGATTLTADGSGHDAFVVDLQSPSTVSRAAGLPTTDDEDELSSTTGDQWGSLVVGVFRSDGFHIAKSTAADQWAWDLGLPAGAQVGALATRPDGSIIAVGSYADTFSLAGLPTLTAPQDGPGDHEGLIVVLSP